MAPTRQPAAAPAFTRPHNLRMRLQPEIADVVVQSILHHQQTLNHYQLHAYVVMAIHVHLLITPRVAAPKLMHSLKRFTARKANEILNLTGQSFWQDESYDHLVGNQIEFGKIANYIEMNPVRAGLVTTPEAFV